MRHSHRRHVFCDSGVPSRRGRPVPRLAGAVARVTPGCPKTARSGGTSDLLCESVSGSPRGEAPWLDNEGHMSNASKSNDWTRPAALAIPKEGYFTLEQGRYGPTYPRTPACHGFTIIAKIKPGTEG